MGNKVIMILVDALNYKIGSSAMGIMKHLTDSNLAIGYRIKTELPTLSRPLYETILTGTPCSVNGIFNNQIVRRSHEKSVFDLARENSLTTAAAAYHWVSELYNKAPFNPLEDRDQEDENANIQYGRFYFDDAYPDSHLFLDGEQLRKKHDPDFLFIHPMGVDYVGHAHGCDSREYRGKIIEIDNILGSLVPLWIELGYYVIITADHGMDSLGLHNGIEEDERTVPLWIVKKNINKELFKNEYSQLEIAPLICKLLEINKSEKMLNID